ncbi:hypothetical protein vseg_005735 [Gypsophila vaccaria]
MELGGSILDAIDEEPSFGDSDDVDMMDVEEGEVVDGKFSGGIGDKNEKELGAQLQDVNVQGGSDANKKKRKKKKRKSKKAKASNGPGGFDLDRFVIGVCKRLREKKSYLVYTAVGVLGASAFDDLVKEVDAIQACGGQKTAEGNRYRTGGGVLWNILKTRDPNAYREIMKKGREFEKQFKRPSTMPPAQSNFTFQDVRPVIVKPIENGPDDDLDMKTSTEGPVVQPTGENRRSVHDRIRVPVSYDDLPGEDSLKEQLS